MAGHFNYIYENLEKIKNPNDVDIIKPGPAGKGTALWARLNNGEAVQLTEPQGVMTFPFEPIYWLRTQLLGRFYFENFATVDNKLSINKTHLTRLGYIDTNEKRVKTYAYFDDWIIITLYDPLRKYFFKEFKAELEQKFGIPFEDITEEVKQQNELNKK